MIDRFDGDYRFLSNFWFLENPVVWEGRAYWTVETAFQSAKTLVPSEIALFSEDISPGKAKALGRRVTLRPDWESVKVEVMSDLVMQKFLNNPDLASALLDTGTQPLIEGNTWNDTFWGVCRGKGQNYLGRILMSVREHLRSAS